MANKAYSSYTVVDVVDGLQWQSDSSSHPANPKEGWAYYNTLTKQSYLYDGEKWVVFAKDGADAKLVTISQSAMYFKSTTGKDGIFTPNDIYLYPRFQAVGYGQWEYSVNGGSTWIKVTSGLNGLTIDDDNHSLYIENSSPLFTNTVTSISFKCVSTDSTVYSITTVGKIHDVVDIDIITSVATAQINTASVKVFRTENTVAESKYTFDTPITITTYEQTGNNPPEQSNKKFKYEIIGSGKLASQSIGNGEHTFTSAELSSAYDKIKGNLNILITDLSENIIDSKTIAMVPQVYKSYELYAAHDSLNNEPNVTINESGIVVGWYTKADFFSNAFTEGGKKIWPIGSEGSIDTTNLPLQNTLISKNYSFVWILNINEYADGTYKDQSLRSLSVLEAAEKSVEAFGDVINSSNYTSPLGYWCKLFGQHFIDGSAIYTGSIEADKIVANSIDASKLSIGYSNSRNLLLKSNQYIEKADYLLNEYDLTEELVEGQDYTISIDGEPGRIGDQKFFAVWSTCYNENSVLTFDKKLGDLLYDNKSGKYIATFTYLTDKGTSANKKKIYIYANTYYKDYVYPTSIIRTVQLEKGNVATYWNLASTELGGWRINENSISNNENPLLATIGMSPGISVANNEYTFWAGGTPSNATFSVTKSGYLKATSGNIGGWTIYSDEFYSDYVGFYTGEDYRYKGADENYIRIYAGTYNPSTETPFYVTNAGYLKSTSGQIGGWNITKTSIENKFISGVIDGRSVGIAPGIDTETMEISNVKQSADPKKSLCFWAGAKYDANTTDASKVAISNAPFRVYSDGSLYASKGTFSGTLNAVKGYIGPWTISNDNLSAATGSGTALLSSEKITISKTDVSANKVGDVTLEIDSDSKLRLSGYLYNYRTGYKDAESNKIYLNTSKGALCAAYVQSVSQTGDGTKLATVYSTAHGFSKIFIAFGVINRKNASTTSGNGYVSSYIDDNNNVTFFQNGGNSNAGGATLVILGC